MFTQKINTEEPMLCNEIKQIDFKMNKKLYFTMFENKHLVHTKSV